MRLVRRRLATSPQRFHLLFGAASTPHPEKRDKGGEDAFFACPETSSFGVADGVGGSARDRVDPGLFSRSVLRNCLATTKRYAGVASSSPLAQLSQAVRESGHALVRAKTGGSSTLLLGQLSPSGELGLINIGDSAAMLLRPAARRFKRSQPVAWPRMVLRSHEQTHYFNCPYQVACDDVVDTYESSADQLQATAKAGDIVIAATDGVTDNLFDEQLQSLVARQLPQLMSADQAECRDAAASLATEIAREAVRVGMAQDDPNVHTPFAMHAQMEGYNYPGGKLDDVAVVCAVVRRGACCEDTRGLRLLSNFEE